MMSLLNKIGLFLTIAILLSVDLQVVSAATPYPQELIQLKQDLKAQLESSSYASCKEQLVPIYDLELLEFFKYLEETFENKSSNSTLNNLAIARYSRFRYRINAAFAEVSPSNQSDTQTYLQLLTAYNKCAEITDAYVNLGKEKLIEYVKSKNSQKQSSILLEKYKAIGSNLREMNVQVAQMYSYYLALNNKLPGFLRQCIKN